MHDYDDEGKKRHGLGQKRIPREGGEFSLFFVFALGTIFPAALTLFLFFLSLYLSFFFFFFFAFSFLLASFMYILNEFVLPSPLHGHFERAWLLFVNSIPTTLIDSKLLTEYQ